LEELVSLADRTVRIRRDTGNGWEIVETELPVLATVTGTANRPRPEAVRKMLRFKKARVEAELAAEVKAEMRDASAEQRSEEVQRRLASLGEAGLRIDQWDLDDIGADLARCGLAGSPTKVYKVQSIVLTKEGYTEIPATEDGARQLIHELVVDHTLG
jgi:electron transfer flavoprotein beta subunit